jgi:putative phage-type endonuclease
MLTAEQHERRSKGIGASDVAAIVGLYPWATAIDVWREKRGEVDREPASADVERGHWMEPVIASWYAAEYGVELVECDTLAHPVFPWVLATPDRVVLTDEPEGPFERVVEIKARRESMRRYYGVPGTDECAEWDLCQLMWQMLVTGARRGDLAVSFGGGVPVVYTVTYDERIADRLFEAARAFWFGHVLSGVRPPASPEDRIALVEYRYPAPGRGLAAAPPEAAEVVERLRIAREQSAEAARIARECEAALVEWIGPAEGIVGDGWACRWSAGKTSTRTDWKALALELGADPELCARYTKTTTAKRSIEFEEIDH